jgi:nitric oxide synthase oxygenase domain/subunit
MYGTKSQAAVLFNLANEKIVNKMKTHITIISMNAQNIKWYLKKIILQKKLSVNWIMNNAIPFALIFEEDFFQTK